MTEKGFNSNVISKTLAVLRAFTDTQKEWGVNELARFLDVPVSSLHRILKILRAENILEMSSSGKYKFGSEMIRMSAIISSKVDIKSIARPFLAKLSDWLNESVYLALFHPQHKKMSFITSVHSTNNALQYVLELGVLHPVSLAFSGKAILAFLEPKEIDAILTEQGISAQEQKQLQAELVAIREQGYSLTMDERKIGAFGISAPIFDASEKVIGSVVCVIPIKNFDENQKEAIVAQVKEQARQISHALGY